MGDFGVTVSHNNRKIAQRLVDLPAGPHFDEMHYAFNTLYPGLSTRRRVLNSLKAGDYTPSTLVDEIEDFYKHYYRNDASTLNALLQSVSNYRRQLNI